MTERIDPSRIDPRGARTPNDRAPNDGVRDDRAADGRVQDDHAPGEGVPDHRVRDDRMPDERVHDERVQGDVVLKAGDVSRYLDADASERAAEEAARWIKALRLLPVDGVPLRERFTYRGDSLWWFAELYLHKQGAIDRLWRTALALDALCRGDRGRPRALTVVPGDPALDLLAPQMARRYGIPFQVDTTVSASRAPTRGRAGTAAQLALDLRSRFYTWSAFASRLRPPRTGSRRTRSRGRALGRDRALAAGGDAGVDVGAGGTLAFVHSAFWRKPAGSDAGDADEGQEGYIGAVLHALRARAEGQPLRLVGVGPRTNFKARRWWHAIVPSRAGAGEIPVEPIERFASWRALAGSRAVWRDRLTIERALLASEAIRAHATILGCDVWPLIATELRGVARLQFPWSARAMDEAGAAMDAVGPRLIVTYAEAGGWGRALMLEARRRGIPSVGLQHGFIYRHWLNYRHEPDEMQPSPANPADRGFPRPDRTLVYDGYAAQHLVRIGNFAENAVCITGSPALDALVASVSRLDPAARTQTRAALDALGAAIGPASGPDIGRTHIVVLVTKFSQVRDALPALLGAIAMLDRVRLVIKPHPAETADPYLAAASAAAAAAKIVIAPPALDLARLLAVARLLVTVNSTVAIDAIALGVPALVVGLPNNLSPFVEAGVMAGGPGLRDAAGLASAIGPLLEDETRREAVLARARAFAAEHAMLSDGRAAERAADAILGLIAPIGGARPSRPV